MGALLLFWLYIDRLFLNNPGFRLCPAFIAMPAADWVLRLQGKSLSVAALDLRNHGKSAQQAFPEPHDLAATAGDIVSLVSRNFQARGPQVIIGHSLGGKVVLAYLKLLAQSAPPPVSLPRQVSRAMGP